MNHQQHSFRGAHLTHTDEPQSFSDQLNHDMHEAFAPESDWIAQLSNQAHSCHTPQYPALSPSVLHVVDMTVLSQAYETVRRNNELIQSLRHLPAITQETSIVPFTAMQHAFDSRSALPEPGPTATAAQTIEDAQIHQSSTTSEHLVKQISPFVAPPSWVVSGYPPPMPKPSVNIPKDPSPAGDINLCHECDTFLRSFAYYRHTTIHLGSGTCTNCEHREISPTLPPRLSQDMPPVPRVRRRKTPTVALASSARGVYYCSHPYCNRGSRKGKPFARKDNLNVHVKNVHRDSTGRVRSLSEGEDGSDDIEGDGRV